MFLWVIQQNAENLLPYGCPILPVTADIASSRRLIIPSVFETEGGSDHARSATSGQTEYTAVRATFYRNLHSIYLRTFFSSLLDALITTLGLLALVNAIAVTPGYSCDSFWHRIVQLSPLYASLLRSSRWQVDIQSQGRPLGPFEFGFSRRDLFSCPVPNFPSGLCT